MSQDSSNNSNKKIQFDIVETLGGQSDYMSLDNLPTVISALKKNANNKAIKFALSEHPDATKNQAAVYKTRTGLLHPNILKRIRDSEELIGGIILPLKANQISLFGRPRPNRFDVGFTINIQPQAYSQLSDQEIDTIKREIIPQLRDLISNCGKSSGLLAKDRITFSQFLKQIVEDALLFGWWAVEVRRDAFGNFHSFRAVDAGTIYYATPSQDNTQETQAIRNKAREALSRIEGHKIPIEPFVNGQYTWVQVINDQPYQVFTDDQLIVWSLNPSTDIMRAGYPVSIIERIIDSVTMHINLTNHNKLFFVNGRAARSILVFKSNNLDSEDIDMIRQQMTNHINSSNASWRMPVFGITPNDEINIVPLDGGGRDMEFTYLADLNKRMILAAFQVSPDEIASLSYLSRGTNSQALAESNNEWKLLKSQQAALRPFLNALSDFINLRLLPVINPDWAKLVAVYFEGLDADTPEKEATLISQATSLYYTFNDILDRVEHDRVKIGGDFPLNAAYLQILERYFTMGEILETFEPERYKGASKDPKFQFYINNPAWFQYQNLLLQKEQIQLQQAQLEQQAQAQQQEQAQQQAQAQQQEEAEQKTPANQEQEGQGQSGVLEQSEGENDLDSALAQMEATLQQLSKAEKDLPKNRKHLLQLHKKAKQKILSDFEKQSKTLADQILTILKTGKLPHDH